MEHLQDDRTQKVIENIRRTDLNAAGMLNFSLKNQQGTCLSESELVEAAKMLKMNPKAGADFISQKTRNFLLNLAKNDPEAAEKKAREFNVSLSEISGMKAAYVPQSSTPQATPPESGVVETEADVMALAAKLRGDYIEPVINNSDLSQDGIMRTEADILNFVQKFKEGSI
ncbi:MAG TPA: hypothetical protein PK514_14720 [Spirochaetota bacterium]|nr:hypothetical protein [Spirochaetota bacterium]